LISRLGCVFFKTGTKVFPLVFP